jgi:hypothetical protein
MTNNLIKNFAALTVAGAVLSFSIASLALGFSAIVHLTSGKTTGQKTISSVVSAQQ